MNHPSVPPERPVLPDPPTTVVRLKPTSPLPWLVVLVGVVAIVGLYLAGIIRLPARGDSAAEKDEWFQELAEHNSEFGQFLEETRRQTGWESADRLLQSLTQTLETLTTERSALEQDFERLSKSEPGRGIAGRSELVEQFVAIRAHERVTQAELDNYAAVIPKYQAVCQQALADRTIVFDPQQSLGVDLHEMQTQMEGQLQQVQADRAALNSLVAAAGNAPPSDVPLEQAAGALEEAHSRQFLERLAAEKAQLRQESEEKMRAVELAAERERLAAEERQRAAEAQAQVDAAEVAAAEAEQRVVDERAKRERVAEFEKQLKRIRFVLSPMISSGKMQLDKNGGWLEDDPGPLSLAVLQPICVATLQNPSGYALLNVFSTTTRNDRPLGAWPAFGPDGLPETRRAAQFIIDYGDLLVECELLRP